MLKSISVAKAILVGIFVTMFSVMGNLYTHELGKHDSSTALLLLCCAMQVATAAMAIHFLFKEE